MPYSGEMSDQRTVRVATCHDPAEATIIRMVLLAHGIEAIIPGEGTASLVGITAAGFRAYVYVAADHAAEALALITDMRDGSGAAAVEAELGGDEPERAPLPRAVARVRRP
jgi:hypothetical protein